MFRYKLVLALLKVIESDFKTATVKFVSQGIEKEAIDSYFKKFKEAKTRNKIKDENEKNIDFWAKKPWKEFKAFVDSMQKTYTKTEQKKQPWKFGNVAGAKKVAENTNWVVYKVDTYAAAKKLGTNNWCIVRNEEFWDDFKLGRGQRPSIFYFALSKIASYDVLSPEVDDRNIEYENPSHRIAIQSLYDNEIYWDADDDEYGSLSQMPWVHKKSKRDSPPPLPIIKFERPDDYCDSCENGVYYCECEPPCGGCGYNYEDCCCCEDCGSYPCVCEEE